jgi:asparagine synthase (glutamine-hydrolysing)
MCGIVGYTNVRRADAADPAILSVMCQTLLHRGPNDHGVFVEGPVGIGMRRLSIIAVSSGHQPISNETGTIWIVFNGEIYNYQGLAKDLTRRGHTFKTISDTEVIVHLYEEYGEACVDHLRGMFAFAIWDRTRGRMFLARDRLGVKPLYYWWRNGQLVFGSELKAVLAHPDVVPTLNAEGLLYYLRYSYIPDPLTIFQDIHKLPPGHTLSLTDGCLSVKSYWDGCLPNETDSQAYTENSALEHLEYYLKEATRMRLISEVPLGAFLSGGIDSSLTVALMAQEMDRPVSTFSIGFQEKAYNELPYARLVARHLGTDHHELIVGPESCDLIPQLVSHFDEPFGDSSAIPTYHVSRMAAEHVTVALSGDGGDELFAGYDRYQVDLARQRRKLPEAARSLLGTMSGLLPDGTKGKNLLRNMSLSGPARYLDNISYVPPADLHRLLAPDYQYELQRIDGAAPIFLQYFDRVRSCDWLSQLQYVDSKTYLTGDVLTKVDRMSMAHSLEVRSPFLDHIFIEQIAGYPSHFKMREGCSKYLLKKLARKYLPADIVDRPKQGFGVPLEYWFAGEFHDYIRDTLMPSSARIQPFFDSKVVQSMVNRHAAGEKPLSAVIWNLLVLETWFQLYLDRPHVIQSQNSTAVVGA